MKTRYNTHMKYPELTFSRDNLDLPGIVQGLNNHGCVLLKQLFPGDFLKSLLPRAVESFEHWEANLPQMPEAVQKYYAMHNNQLPSYELTRKGENPLLIYHLFLSSPLVDIMHAVLGATYYMSMIHTVVRRQMPSRPKDFTQYHQDGYFFNPEWRVIHCWFPIVNCGEDAPSLELIPAGLKDIRPSSHKPFKGDHYYDNRDLDMDTDILPYFPKETFWTMVLEPGDAILYDNFALHRTYCTPEMTQARYNLEIRFVPDVDLPKDLIEKGMIKIEGSSFF